MNVLAVTGRLSSDPARRDTTKGVVCEFRLAVDGQRRLWLPVVCWGHLAGTCARHLRKGRRVAVDGQLQVDEFIGAGGDLRRRWYLRADHVSFDTAATDLLHDDAPDRNDEVPERTP